MSSPPSNAGRFSLRWSALAIAPRQRQGNAETRHRAHPLHAKLEKAPTTTRRRLRASRSGDRERSDGKPLGNAKMHAP